MKRVIIASTNPVKIKAVQQGFGKMFPQETFEFQGTSVPSKVRDQPFGDQETFTGAKNRADNASQEMPEADFYVGIEGGLEMVGEEMQSFAWVVVKSAQQYGKSKTSAFFLPQEMVKLITEGIEQGEATDIVFKSTNSKQHNGTVGILTDDVIDRTKYYTEAVVLALILFKNPQLY